MLAATLLALLAVAPAAAPAPGGDRVEASADLMVVQPSTRALHLLGGATLRYRHVILRADELDHDPALGVARAQGHVVFVGARSWVGVADRVSIALAQQTGTFYGATFFQKTHVTPAQLAAAATPDALRLVGDNALTLRADVVRRMSPTTFEAQSLYLTPCDCKGPAGTSPPWSVRAKRGVITLGQSARLTWAMLYVKSVPVLPLPLVLLPLSNRQTGFLLPRPNYSALNGFQLEEPFFWAISRSVDATFTPGYFFGETHGNSRDPSANYGMRGIHLGAELRYVPSAGTHGALELGAVYDLKPDGARAHRGLRGGLGYHHAQALGAGFGDRVDLSLVTDQRYFRDITADVIAAQQGYLRSDARIDHASANTSASLAGSYYQALSGTPSAPAPTLQPLFGPHDVNRDTFQRLPALQLASLEQPLGPLRWRAQVDAVRYAPLTARDPPCVVGPSCSLGLALASSRQIEDRVGVQPEVRLPLRLGPAAELAPYVLVRADAWHEESGTQTSRARALALVGAVARTELARVYDAGGGVRYRHVIEPAVEVRGMPFAAGSAPCVPDDERDAPLAGAAPCPATERAGAALPAMFQAVAALRTRLDRRDGNKVTEPVRAEVGQGYDLIARAPADSFAALALQLGPLATSGAIRYAPTVKQVSSLTARARWTFANKSVVSLGYDRLRANLTDPMRAGLWDLVGPPIDAATPAGATSPFTDRLDASGRWQATPSLGVALALSYLPHARLLDAFSLHPSGTTAPWRRLLSYAAAISYESPCKCWGVRARALFQPAALGGRPFTPTSFFVTLDLHRLGGNLGN